MRYNSTARALVVFALVATTVTLNALAITPDISPSHFQQIPNRNVFGLKPPEVITPTNPPPQLPKLILTGITTILGNKRALLKEQPVTTPGKPVDPTKEESHILTEGQREGNVEVLQIDEKAGSVKVNLAGTIQTLTFEKDGPKLPSTPPPNTGTTPGTPVMGVLGGAGAPGVTPGAVPAMGIVDSTHTNPPLPTRTPRWPVTGSASAAGAAQVPSPTGRPTTALPTTSAVPNGSTPSPLDLQGLTPEEQRIVQQLQQAAQPAVVAPTTPTSSGKFETPPQEGITPAFSIPPPPPLPANPRQLRPQ